MQQSRVFQFPHNCHVESQSTTVPLIVDNNWLTSRKQNKNLKATKEQDSLGQFHCYNQ